MAANMLDYVVYVPKERVRGADAWCRDELGERWSVVANRQGQWACFWEGTRTSVKPGTYRFMFKDEETAMWFALKWS